MPLVTSAERQDCQVQRIRDLRQARELTIEQLAHRAGLTFTTVSRIERGVNEPTLATLRSLAAALETTVDDLIGVHS